MGPTINNVANPLVLPELIQGTEQFHDLPALVTVEDFKKFLTVSGDGEDDNLEELLLSVVNDIKRPDSLGIEFSPAMWKLNVDLNSYAKYAFLPKWNGGMFTSVSWNADGEELSTTFSALSDFEEIFNLPLVKVSSGDVPSRARFTYPVGLSEGTFSPKIRELIFIEAAIRREFPLGLGDQGQDISARSPASDIIRAELAPVYNIRGLLLR